MSFDSRCYDLAEIFLADEPNVTEAHKNALAQEIQTTIEDFIAFDLAQPAVGETEFQTIAGLDADPGRAAIVAGLRGALEPLAKAAAAQADAAMYCGDSAAAIRWRDMADAAQVALDEAGRER